MEQFLAVNLVSIVQLIAFIGGGIWIVSSMKSVQEIQSQRLEKVEQELFQLRNVVVDIARQSERLNAMDQRMLTQGRRLDRLSDKIFRREHPVEEDASS
jgi:hypothetical protein